MSVLSGNGGGAWEGDEYQGRHRKDSLDGFDVPWLCPDLAVCVGHTCDGGGCLRVQRGSPGIGAYPGEPPGRWPQDVIERYGERARRPEQEQ